MAARPGEHFCEARTGTGAVHRPGGDLGRSWGQMLGGSIYALPEMSQNPQELIPVPPLWEKSRENRKKFAEAAQQAGDELEEEELLIDALACSSSLALSCHQPSPGDPTLSQRCCPSPHVPSRTWETAIGESRVHRPLPASQRPQPATHLLGAPETGREPAGNRRGRCSGGGAWTEATGTEGTGGGEGASETATSWVLVHEVIHLYLKICCPFLMAELIQNSSE